MPKIAPVWVVPLAECRLQERYNHWPWSSFRNALEPSYFYDFRPNVTTDQGKTPEKQDGVNWRITCEHRVILVLRTKC